MIRRAALAFVFGLAYLIVLAEVQRLDDQVQDQIQQVRAARQ
jgi:hypothetical protein